MPKISIKKADISHPDKGSVTLQNPVLRNLLVQEPSEAMDWLKTKVSAVQPSEVSIDDHGGVVVANAAFAKEIAERLQTNRVDAAGDTACSNGSCARLRAE
jgi:hypothetical protein